MNKNDLDLLYRSFDAELSPQQESKLQKALAASQELREEQQRIFEMRMGIAESAQSSFRPFFSARVMQKIEATQEQPEALFANLVRYFQGFAIAGGMAVALLIFLNFQSSDTVSADALLGLPKIQLEDTWQLDDYIAEVNYDR